MKPNPGGIITGEAIIDREQKIEEIWRALDNQSAVLISERRVGKTSVLRKMQENPKNNWIPVLYHVEGKWHPVEFIEGLYELLLGNNIIGDKFHKLKKFYTKYVGGEQIGSWKLPSIKENWKTLLESLIEDIVESDIKVLLMFDELPLMVSHFLQNEKECGPKVSMEFLDTIRELRNKYESSKHIAFIFCGSIGIHLVIKDLKKNYGYNSDPINNMKIISLSGMDNEGAYLLCEKLSEDENYNYTKKNEIFNYICKKTDNLPFYIQWIFELILDSKKQNIDKKLIDEVITYLLNDPDDKGFFSHYTDRIKTYYDKSNQELALFILDRICKKNGYIKEEEILNIVKTNEQVENEMIKEVLNLLWSDHYLKRKLNERSYKFKYMIIREWWKINRG